jgi:hypothetical protein
MQNYDKILDLFTDKYHDNPALRQPNKVGDKVYATDAFTLLVVPQSRLTGTYETHPRVPDFEGLIQDAYDKRDFLKNVDCVLTLEGINRLVGAIPKEPIYLTCPKCDGNGKWTCESCEHEHKCESCNETGYTSRQIDFSINRDAHVFKMNDASSVLPIKVLLLLKTIAMPFKHIYYTFIGDGKHMFRTDDLMLYTYYAPNKAEGKSVHCFNLVI